MATLDLLSNTLKMATLDLLGVWLERNFWKFNSERQTSNVQNPIKCPKNTEKHRKTPNFAVRLCRTIEVFDAFLPSENSENSEKNVTPIRSHAPKLRELRSLPASDRKICLRSKAGVRASESLNFSDFNFEIYRPIFNVFRSFSKFCRFYAREMNFSKFL